MRNTGNSENQNGVKNSRKLIKEKSSARHVLVYNQVAAKNPPKRKSPDDCRETFRQKSNYATFFCASWPSSYLFSWSAFISSPPLFLEVRVYTAAA